MPTKRRRSSRRVQAPLSDAVIYVLETGDFPRGQQFSTWYDAYRVDEEGEREAAWTAGKSMVLEDWIERRPGTRPDAWWEFDAPDDRRRLADGRYKAEAVYLKRHRLLMPAELERLTTQAFEPVAIEWAFDTEDE